MAAGLTRHCHLGPRFKPFAKPSLVWNLNALTLEKRGCHLIKKFHTRSNVVICFLCFLCPLSTFSFDFLLRPWTDFNGKLLSTILKFNFDFWADILIFELQKIASTSILSIVQHVLAKVKHTIGKINVVLQDTKSMDYPLLVHTLHQANDRHANQLKSWYLSLCLLWSWRTRKWLIFELDQ